MVVHHLIPAIIDLATLFIVGAKFGISREEMRVNNLGRAFA
jgi:hypothetical protein